MVMSYQNGNKRHYIGEIEKLLGYKVKIVKENEGNK